MIRKVIVLVLYTSFIFGTSRDIFDTQDRSTRLHKGDVHIRTGYAYSLWKTSEMKNFKMKNEGLNTAWAELIFGDFYNPIFYPNFLLHVEHSFNKAEEPNKVFNINKSVNLDDAYLRVLGTVRVNHFFFKYEYEKFSSALESLDNNNFFVDETGLLNSFPNESKLISETIFKDYSLGYSYRNVDVYAFYSDYQKPYTIRRSGQENVDYANLLLYPQVTAYGLGFRWYMTKNNFYFLPELKLGKGELELTNELDYSDFKGIKGITYTGLKLTTGYRGEITRSLNYHLAYIGELRNFSEEDSNENESSINEDTTHKVMLSLQYSF